MSLSVVYFSHGTGGMEILSRVLDYTKSVTCGSMEAARVLLIP